jgi:hypothetical protein
MACALGTRLAELEAKKAVLMTEVYALDGAITEVRKKIKAKAARKERAALASSSSSDDEAEAKPPAALMDAAVVEAEATADVVEEATADVVEEATADVVEEATADVVEELAGAVEEPAEVAELAELAGAVEEPAEVAELAEAVTKKKKKEVTKKKTAVTKRRRGAEVEGEVVPLLWADFEQAPLKSDLPKDACNGCFALSRVPPGPVRPHTRVYGRCCFHDVKVQRGRPAGSKRKAEACE